MQADVLSFIYSFQVAVDPPCQHEDSPEKHSRAVNTVDAHLRNARSLFTPKTLEFVGKQLVLPDPLPFTSVTLERKRGTTRNVSRIDPAVLVRQAKEELGDEPKRQEQFKIFCLALLCCAAEYDVTDAFVAGRNEVVVSVVNPLHIDQADAQVFPAKIK